MALDFPNSPSVNDSFSAGGKTWVYNGTKWVLLSVSLNQTVADGAITAAKLASDSVTSAKIVADSITSAKIAAGAVGTTDLAANAVTQAKLAANVSGITITTTANRDTDIPSPFTGQFCFLTDTSVLQRYTGSAWIVAIATAPAAPTALSGTALSTTSVSIAFTPGADNGATITNYQYALSTDSGSTYGSFLALDPADATSPITISGLTASTTYTIKLKAVNTMGAGTESAGVSVTTRAPLTVNYLVIAGGGAGGGVSNYNGYHAGGGGGGAGGLRSTVTTTGGGGTLETALSPTLSTNYSVQVGAGGTALGSGTMEASPGVNSVFATITSIGGGRGYSGGATVAAGAGGSGGGSGRDNTVAGTGTANQGYAGAASGGGTGGRGGGGAGSVGVTGSAAAGTTGGSGVAVSITGSSVTYAGGGGGGGGNGGGTGGAGGSGGGGTGGASNTTGNNAAGTVNTGSGGGAAGAYTDASNTQGASGGSGIVILSYPSAYTITIGAGLIGTTATVSSNKVTTITAGSGNVSWA